MRHLLTTAALTLLATAAHAAPYTQVDVVAVPLDQLVKVIPQATPGSLQPIFYRTDWLDLGQVDASVNVLRVRGLDLCGLGEQRLELLGANANDSGDADGGGNYEFNLPTHGSDASGTYVELTAPALTDVDSLMLFFSTVDAFGPSCEPTIELGRQ